MSRTFRRKHARHEYDVVLNTFPVVRAGDLLNGSTRIDPKSPAGRRALAYYHSDRYVWHGASAPRIFRKSFQRKMDTYNERMMRRWMVNHEYDPVFYVQHRHRANYAWW